MAEKRITVRMEDGDPPVVSVTVRAEYEHAEQGGMAGATSHVEAVISGEQRDSLRRAMQDILDANEARVVRAARRGRIKAEAAALRMAGED